MMAQPLGGRLDLQCEAMAAGSDGAWDRGRGMEQGNDASDSERESRTSITRA
jgi:hypothetical protein